MRHLLPAIFLVCAACNGDDGDDVGDDGDDTTGGPYDDLPIEQEFTSTGVSAPVDVVRDEEGVPHVLAASVADVAFAQGYVMASHRMQQMDLLRHFAAGRIAELFGALDPGQIDVDLQMRIHRFEAIATETWAMLQASTDPDAQEMVVSLTRFADGVNRYLDDLRAGVHTLDPAVAIFFDPSRTRPWEPVDTLLIGRLLAFQLSFGAEELTDTMMRQRSTAFTGQHAAAYLDLATLLPSDPTATTDDWPPGDGAGAAARAALTTPQVPFELLGHATSRIAERLLDPRNGSNNWVIGPSLAGEGRTMLANDPHLALSSPPIWWAVHLTVPDDLDLTGVTFPGVPGVVLGHNEHLAWGATVVGHDVTDFYLENVVACEGGGDCVTWNGRPVPIETWEETIDIGALGTITESRTVTYERVPHHGPILPNIVNHDIAPRGEGPVISVRYTGHEQTNELGAFHGLWRAATVAEGIESMQQFGYGGQNFVFADDQGNIGWTTHALVPWRTAGCFTFDPTTGQGVAPWWVVPGDGSCEWDGWIDDMYLPQEVNPARGFIATANADPVGTTADGDPLNAPVIDGRLLYIGARYDEGFRIGRITRRLEALAAAGAPLTEDDMAAVQADAFSNLGDALTPRLLAALDAYEAEVRMPGTRPELSAFVAGLDTAARDRIDDARGLLEAWDFETEVDQAEPVAFNAWLVEVTSRIFGDEAEVLGRAPESWLTNALVNVLTRPEVLITGLSPTTGEPVLCDDLRTAAAVESCTLQILVALDAGLAWAAGELGDDPATWRWGDLHTLTLGPLVPSAELAVGPFRRHGDNHSVDASSPGMGDLDFTFGHGPSMRHITTFGDATPRTLLAIPGGQILDRDSGHFRDLIDEYWSVNEYFELAWTVEQVKARHEARWRFR